MRPVAIVIAIAWTIGLLWAAATISPPDSMIPDDLCEQHEEAALCQ